MASEIGSLYVSLTADVHPYAAAMSRAERVTTQATSGIRKNIGVAESAVSRLRSASSSSIRPYGLIAVSRAFDGATDRVSLLRGALLASTAAFGGFTAAISSNLLLRYADTYTNLNNQIRVVSKSTADLRAQFEAVSQVADRSRSSLQSTAILYSRIAKAQPQLASNDVLRYTETIQKALQLGGATIQEASSAAIQFSQALASNRLGGEELRAVLETPLGLQLAKGLGVTIGRFRELSIQGKLTADVVLGALSNIAGDIDSQFEKSVRTVDQALTRADNALTKYVGSTNEAYGGTRILIGGIDAFADNLDTIIPTIGLLAATAGAVFGGRLFARGATAAISQAALVKASFTEAYSAAQESAAALRAEQSRLVKEISATGNQIAKVKFTDPIDLAPKDSLKALAQQRAELEKLDNAKLATLSQVEQAVRRVAAVEIKTTQQQTKLMADQVKQTDALAASNKRQLVLVDELIGAERALAAVRSSAEDVPARAEALAAAQADVAKKTRALTKEFEAQAKVIERTARAEERQVQVVLAGREKQAAANRRQLAATDELIAAENRLHVAQSLPQNLAKNRVELERATKGVAAAETKLASAVTAAAAVNDDLIVQETKLAQLRDGSAYAASSKVQIQLAKDLLDAERQLATAKALSADDPARVQAVAKATQAHTAAVKALTTEQKAAEVLAKSIADRQIKIDQLAAEQLAKSRAERNEALAEEAELKKRIIGIDEQRAAVLRKAQETSRSAVGAGQEEQTRQIRTLTGALGEQRAALTGVQNQSLAVSSVFNRTLRPAITGLQRVGSSLVGFLGGPWGVAFTAATAALAIFGAQAAASAAEVANLNRLIDEYAGKAANGVGELADKAREANSEVTLSNLRQDLEEIAKGALAARNRFIEITSSVARADALTDDFGTQLKAGAADAAVIASRAANLVDALYAGTISISDFQRELGKLIELVPSLGRYRKEFDDLSESIGRAKLSQREVIDQIAEQKRAIDGLKGLGTTTGSDPDSLKGLAERNELIRLYLDSLKEEIALTDRQIAVQKKADEILSKQYGTERGKDPKLDRAADYAASLEIFGRDGSAALKKVGDEIRTNVLTVDAWLDGIGSVADAVRQVADPLGAMTRVTLEQERALQGVAASTLAISRAERTRAAMSATQLAIEEKLAQLRQEYAETGERANGGTDARLRSLAIVTVLSEQAADAARRMVKEFDASDNPLVSTAKTMADLLGLTGATRVEAQRQEVAFKQILAAEKNALTGAANRLTMSEKQAAIEDEFIRLRQKAKDADVVVTLEREKQLRAQAQANILAQGFLDTLTLAKQSSISIKDSIVQMLAPTAALIGLNGDMTAQKREQRREQALALSSYKAATAEILRRSSLTERQRSLEDALNEAARTLYDTTYNGLLPAQQAIVKEIVKERQEAERIAGIRAKTAKIMRETMQYDLGDGNSVSVTRTVNPQDETLPVLQKIDENGVTVYRMVGEQTNTLSSDISALGGRTDTSNGFLSTIASNPPPTAGEIGSAVASAIPSSRSTAADSGWNDKLPFGSDDFARRAREADAAVSQLAQSPSVSRQQSAAPMSAAASRPIVFEPSAMGIGGAMTRSYNPDTEIARMVARDAAGGGSHNEQTNVQVNMFTPPRPQSQDLARATMRADLAIAVRQARR